MLSNLFDLFNWVLVREVSRHPGRSDFILSTLSSSFLGFTILRIDRIFLDVVDSVLVFMVELFELS
jgi:hypothetical protein